MPRLALSILVLLPAAPAAARFAPCWIPDRGGGLTRETDVWGTRCYRGSAPLSPGIAADHFDYDPPLKVLQLPLAVGASWTGGGCGPGWAAAPSRAPPCCPARVGDCGVVPNRDASWGAVKTWYR